MIGSFLILHEFKLNGGLHDKVKNYCNYFDRLYNSEI